MKALIYCAGFGTRLRPITESTAKCMVRVGKKPCVENIINHLNKFGVKDIAVNIHWLYPQIIDYFGCKLLYLYEQELLGTAGTLKCLVPWLGDDFIVCNGDTLTDIDIDKLIQIHLKEKKIATIGWNFEKKHSIGTMILNSKILEYLPDKGMIDDVLSKLDCNFVDYKDIGSYYFDIGTPEHLESARIFYEKLSLLSKV